MEFGRRVCYLCRNKHLISYANVGLDLGERICFLLRFFRRVTMKTRTETMPFSRLLLRICCIRKVWVATFPAFFRKRAEPFVCNRHPVERRAVKIGTIGSIIDGKDSVGETGGLRLIFHHQAVFCDPQLCIKPFPQNRTLSKNHPHRYPVHRFYLCLSFWHG